MELLHHLFGRDAYNIICDYYNPITYLAMRRKEYMNKAFEICINHINFKNIYYDRYSYFHINNVCSNDQWFMRYSWIKRLRSADRYLNNGKEIVLRSRNKDIPHECIHDLYNINSFSHDKKLYEHRYYKELPYEIDKLKDYPVISTLNNIFI